MEPNGKKPEEEFGEYLFRLYVSGCSQGLALCQAYLSQLSLLFLQCQNGYLFPLKLPTQIIKIQDRLMEILGQECAMILPFQTVSAIKSVPLQLTELTGKCLTCPLFKGDVWKLFKESFKAVGELFSEGGVRKTDKRREVCQRMMEKINNVIKQLENQVQRINSIINENKSKK